MGSNQWNEILVFIAINWSEITRLIVSRVWQRAEQQYFSGSVWVHVSTKKELLIELSPLESD